MKFRIQNARIAVIHLSFVRDTGLQPTALPTGNAINAERLLTEYGVKKIKKGSDEPD